MGIIWHTLVSSKVFMVTEKLYEDQTQLSLSHALTYYVALVDGCDVMWWLSKKSWIEGNWVWL